MKILNKHNQGFTLIETLITTGFIMVVSIGGYYVYNKISHGNTINKEIEDIKRIVIEIKPALIQKTKLDINADFLSSYGILDKHKVINNSYQNFLGSQTQFSYIYDLHTHQITHLKVFYPNMTKEYCAKIVNAHEPQSDYISISSFLVKNTLNKESENYPFNIANAFEICNKASIPDNNYSVNFSININK